MDQLQGHKAYQAWSLRGDAPGMEYIHAVLVEAVATEPLILSEHGASFDPSSFFNRVLKMSAVRGSA
jgi:hypothetical protein